MNTFRTITGHAWVFGDNIDTDAIYPGRYLHILDESEMAKHSFEFIKPEFAGKVTENDVIISGRNFGSGSSREQAVLCLRRNGIRVIVARSFARIFYRNAINCGLMALTFVPDDRSPPDVLGSISDGELVKIDLGEKFIEVLSNGNRYRLSVFPEHLMPIIANGGLIEHLRIRLTIPKPDR